MNLSNRNFNDQQKQAFLSGYDTMIDKINNQGWEASRDEFNIANPYNVKYSSVDAYAYASGEFEALKDKL